MPYQQLQQLQKKTKPMADGFNEARALRVMEIMSDFHSLQQRIAEYAPNPPPEDYFEEGYQILRQCRAEAQAVLTAPFPLDLSQISSGSGEQEKRQLQRVIIDASARRFQAKKIYLRAVAAIRWSNARNNILQGQRPHQGHTAYLQQITNTLRNELATITDSRIVNEFRQADSQAGYWLQDDPPRNTILEWIRSHAA